MVFVQTDIYSLFALVLGAGAFGGLVAWWLTRRRRRFNSPVEIDSPSNIYLLFSRTSHRLKTVGEVIRGHLHGFTDELPQDAERWRVARKAITDGASEIDTLVNRLDLVVRLGMSEQLLVIEPVNLPRLLEDLMVDLGPAADAKGILLGGIVSNSDPDGSYVISADPMALREVFSNLLENAVKHNSLGTEVSAEVKLQNDRMLVRIADNGKGLSADLVKTIFDKGSRHYRPGSQARSTGMGLYLAKLLVELHGGEIAVDSQPGAGTEFRVTLPLRRTDLP
ncbi:MAG TPA: HAMP domain-containing sensor histidine kinase [Dehalococcoidia bacterium]|nr:HAMP domain-containing sensor histidine kinase [Dehalococcoidia bacterium]